MNDAVLIVDHDQLSRDAARRRQQLDPERYAQGLGLMSRPLGQNVRRIALVAVDDAAGAAAYQQAHFELVAMNGSRPGELSGFIAEMNEFVGHTALKRLVVASADPTFALLCARAQQKGIAVSVWAPRGAVPDQLREYNDQPLEELLPDLKAPRIDVRLDYENLHFGLVARGWIPDTRALVAAVKAEAAALGEVVSIVAYADWTLLGKRAKRDVQRELALEGVDTRYQVNLRGKNSADMRMADDIAALVQDSNASGVVDLVVLGTCDRDFRPTAERVKSRGKRLVIFALENGTSWQLRDVAEVRCLDRRLGLGPSARPVQPDKKRSRRPAVGAHPLPWDEHAGLLVQVIAWLQNKGWKWGFAGQIAAEAGLGLDAALRLERAVAAGVFTRRTRPARERLTGAAREALTPNPAHPLVAAAAALCAWIPNRVRACLTEKRMPYVDSHYLAYGMAMDRSLQKLGVAQARREAEGWLDLAAQAGLVVKKSQPNPRGPGAIHTWWLPETPAPSAQASQGPIPSGPPVPPSTPAVPGQEQPGTQPAPQAFAPAGSGHEALSHEQPAQGQVGLPSEPAGTIHDDQAAQPSAPAGSGLEQPGQGQTPPPTSPSPTHDPAREPKAPQPPGLSWPGRPFESPRRPVSQAS